MSGLHVLSLSPLCPQCLAGVSAQVAIGKYPLKEWVAGRMSECTASPGFIRCQALPVCKPTVRLGAPVPYASLDLLFHPQAFGWAAVGLGCPRLTPLH